MSRFLDDIDNKIRKGLKDKYEDPDFDWFMSDNTDDEDDEEEMYQKWEDER